MRAQRKREFKPEQCSEQPFMPVKKAFWRDGSINFFERTKMLEQDEKFYQWRKGQVTDYEVSHRVDDHN